MGSQPGAKQHVSLGSALSQGPSSRGTGFPGPKGRGTLSVPIWFGWAPAGQACSAVACDFWWWSGLDWTMAPEVGEHKGLGGGRGGRQEWGWREAGILYWWPRQGKQARGAVRPGWGTVQATCEGLSEAPALDPYPTALLGPVCREQDYLGDGAPHFHQREGPGRVTRKVAVMALPTGRDILEQGRWGRHAEASFLLSHPHPSGQSGLLQEGPEASPHHEWPLEAPAWGLRWGSFSCSRRTASTRKGPSRKARKPGT